MPHNLTQAVVTVVIVAVVMLLRMRGATRTRPLKLEQLWYVPTVFAAIAAFTLWQAPPQPSDLPWLAGAFLLGTLIGWYRGKMMRISVDPETHALNQSTSPLAFLFLLAIFGVRYAIRYFMAEEAAAWGISVNVLADAPLLLVVGTFALMRVEMYLRAQRLLQEARAAKTARAA